MQETLPQKNRGGFLEWLINVLIIYVIPASVVVYIDYTHCWPYSLVRKFYSTTRFKNSPNIQDDMLYTFVFIILASIFYLINYLFKKKKYKPPLP